MEIYNKEVASPISSPGVTAFQTISYLTGKWYTCEVSQVNSNGECEYTCIELIDLFINTYTKVSFEKCGIMEKSVIPSFQVLHTENGMNAEETQAKQKW